MKAEGSGQKAGGRKTTNRTNPTNRKKGGRHVEARSDFGHLRANSVAAAGWERPRRDIGHRGH